MNLYFKEGNATADSSCPHLEWRMDRSRLGNWHPMHWPRLDWITTRQRQRSLLAVPRGSQPTGYALYKRSDRNGSLVWEEKAPVSVARNAYDGVEVLNGKIYFTGGANSSGNLDIVELYDPVENDWSSINSLNDARLDSPQLY